MLKGKGFIQYSFCKIGMGFIISSLSAHVEEDSADTSENSSQPVPSILLENKSLTPDQELEELIIKMIIAAAVNIRQPFAPKNYFSGSCSAFAESSQIEMNTDADHGGMIFSITTHLKKPIYKESFFSYSYSHYHIDSNKTLGCYEDHIPTIAEKLNFINQTYFLQNTEKIKWIQFYNKQLKHYPTNDHFAHYHITISITPAGLKDIEETCKLKKAQ